MGTSNQISNHPENHTHCQVAQSQSHEPKLVKEYDCPTHCGKPKVTTPKGKHENLTKCIVNALPSYFQLSLQFDTLVILESVSALTIHGRYV